MKKLLALALLALSFGAYAQTTVNCTVSRNCPVSITGGPFTLIGTSGSSYTLGASGLTVGTTAIGSGTTTRILYDNAGVLGEYTISGTGTTVAMTASPTFTGTVGAAAITTSGNVTFGTGSAGGQIVSNMVANGQWLSLQYASTEYLKAGLIASTAYGIGGGSTFGSNSGITFGNNIAKIIAPVSFSIGTSGADFSTFDNQSNTNPSLTLNAVGLTTKPGLLIQQTTATTAVPLKINLNGVEQFSVSSVGVIASVNLKTTGAATGKTVVCVDTSTGILYASSSGVACAN